MAAIALRLTLLAGLLASCTSTIPAKPSQTSGSVTIDGVQLVAADQALTDACGRAARVVRFAVPCPGLLIAHREPVSCPTVDINVWAGGKDCVENSAAGNPNDATGRLDTFTFQQSDMVLPPDYVGTATAANHMWIVGVRNDSKLAFVRSGCVGEETRAGPVLLDGPSTWVDCPAAASGMHAGHRLLRWQKDGVTYVVSLHGQTSINERIELELARHLVFVR